MHSQDVLPVAQSTIIEGRNEIAFTNIFVFFHFFLLVAKSAQKKAELFRSAFLLCLIRNSVSSLDVSLRPLIHTNLQPGSFWLSVVLICSAVFFPLIAARLPLLALWSSSAPVLFAELLPQVAAAARWPPCDSPFVSCAAAKRPVSPHLCSPASQAVLTPAFLPRRKGCSYWPRRTEPSPAY
jgi:hypothetical protein